MLFFCLTERRKLVTGLRPQYLCRKQTRVLSRFKPITFKLCSVVGFPFILENFTRVIK